jgi:hypothetical protein
VAGRAPVVAAVRRVLVADSPVELLWQVVRWLVVRPGRFCATIRRPFLAVVVKAAKAGRAPVAAVGPGMATLPETSRRDPARVEAVFSAQVCRMVQLVPVVGRAPVLMVGESNDRRAPERVVVVFNDPVDPVVEARVRVRVAAAFNGRIVQDDRVKTVVAFARIDRTDLTMADFDRIVPVVPARVAAEHNGQVVPMMVVDFPIADRITATGFRIAGLIVRAKAAAARDGTATTGATGPTSGPIVFPIAISGTTGETTVAPTLTTTGTTIGTTTITGSTTIGGIIITSTGRTTTTSTIGDGRRGRG